MAHTPHDSTRFFDVRRLFVKSEVDQIRRMQEHAPEFSEHYPKHRQWLEMAVEEVLSGARTAFGIFRIGRNDQHEFHADLIGSIILKEMEYAGVIDLKNLFVREDQRKIGAGRTLYAQVEDHCIKKGYAAIETEVPCAEIDTIRFLHDRGFRVIEMQTSRYKSGDQVYQMAKRLPSAYCGDPFDFKSLAEWILSHHYGFRVKDVSGGLYELRIAPASADFDPVPIIGNALVVDDKTVSRHSLQHVHSLLDGHIGFVFAHALSSDAIEFCATHRLVAMDDAAIATAFGQRLAFGQHAFGRDQVAGMIIVMHPRFYERLDGRQRFTYFKGGPVGKFLKPGDRLLVVSEATPEHPQGGVMGWGTIASVKAGSAQEVWDYYYQQQPIFERAEYQKFTRNKQEVIGISFADFDSVSKVDYYELQKILNVPIDSSRLGHSYLSSDMLDRFERHLRSRSPVEITMEYDVALSFAGEDREKAEALADGLKKRGVKVFYDRYEEAHLWGKDLYQHLQRVYRDNAKFCIVFVSKAYAQRLWTSHELKQAQARAFRERREYILPLKLDDTELPGLNETVGYVSYSAISVEKLADMILQKLAI